MLVSGIGRAGRDVRHCTLAGHAHRGRGHNTANKHPVRLYMRAKTNHAPKLAALPHIMPLPGQLTAQRPHRHVLHSNCPPQLADANESSHLGHRLDALAAPHCHC